MGMEQGAGSLSRGAGSIVAKRRGAVPLQRVDTDVASVIPVPHSARPVALLSVNAITGAMTVMAMALIVAAWIGFALRYGFGPVEFTGPLKIYVTLTHLNLEANLPAWFSTSLLLSCSAAMAMIAFAEAEAPRRLHRQWLGLALLLLFLSADEAGQIHDYSTVAWIAAVGILFLIGGGFRYVPFVLRLPRATVLRAAMAGMVFVTGSLVMDKLAGARNLGHGPGDTVYMALLTLEEGLEMTGAILLLRAMLLHLRDRWGELQLRLT